MSDSYLYVLNNRKTTDSQVQLMQNRIHHLINEEQKTRKQIELATKRSEDLAKNRQRHIGVIVM